MGGPPSEGSQPKDGWRAGQAGNGPSGARDNPSMGLGFRRQGRRIEGPSGSPLGWDQRAERVVRSAKIRARVQRWPSGLCARLGIWEISRSMSDD